MFAGQIEFDEQPLQALRIRTFKERTSGHGVITADRSPDNSKRYPRVRLIISDGFKNEQFYMLCALYEAPNDDPQIASVLSSRLLEKNPERSDCLSRKSRPINYGPIFEQMKQTETNHNEFTFELKDYYIIQPNLGNEKRDSTARQEAWSLLRLENSPNIIALQKRKNAVHLGVTAYRKTGDTYTAFTHTIFSNPIVNTTKEIAIKMLCKTHIGKDGENCTVLMETKVDEHNVEVYVYELDDNSKLVWRQQVPSVQVFKKHVLIFQAPKYEGPSFRDAKAVQVQCVMEVRRLPGNKNDISHFFYTNYKCQVHAPKRARNNPESAAADTEPDKRVKPSSSGISSMPAVAVSPSDVLKKLEGLKRQTTRPQNELIDDLEELNYEHAANSICGNTIFHDAICCGDFEQVCIWFEKLSLKEMLCTVAVNAYGDTLLHCACKHDRHAYIMPLLRMGYKLSAANIAGSTPVHSAIREGHRNTIACIAAIIRNIEEHPTAKDLTKLLDVYDAEGYTALHLAVLRGCTQLVANLLAFGKEQGINVYGKRTLSDRRTIWDIARDNKSEDMIALIGQYPPDEESSTDESLDD